jgi:hypothetical protein
MAHDDTDSESSLPETVSLSTSASAAKGHDRALRNFHAVETRKIREKNRRHDERLKVQANMRRHATAATGKGRLYVENHEVEADDPDGGSDTHHRLHWRMTRAMGDAEEETEEVDSGSTSGEEWGGIKAANEEDYQVSADLNVGMLTDEGEEEKKEETRNGNLDSSEVGGDDDDDGPRTLRPLSPPSKYLPDHLFVAAFSKSKLGNLLRPSRTTPKTRSSGKRHSVRTRTKDVVVGCVSIPPSLRFGILCLFLLFCESESLPQHTCSPRTVIISGKLASSVPGNGPATSAYRQILGEYAKV